MATTRTSAVQTVPILHLRVTTGGFWQTSRTAKQKFIKLHLTPTLHPQAPALLGPDGTSRPDCPCPALQALDSPWAWLWPLPLPAVHHTDAGPQILSLSRLGSLPLGLVGRGCWGEGPCQAAHPLPAPAWPAPAWPGLACCHLPWPARPPQPRQNPFSSENKSFSDRGVQWAGAGGGGVGQWCPGQGRGTAGRDLWPVGSALLGTFSTFWRFLEWKKRKRKTDSFSQSSWMTQQGFACFLAFSFSGFFS